MINQKKTRIDLCLCEKPIPRFHSYIQLSFHRNPFHSSYHVFMTERRSSLKQLLWKVLGVAFMELFALCLIEAAVVFLCKEYSISFW